MPRHSRCRRPTGSSRDFSSPRQSQRQASSSSSSAACEGSGRQPQWRFAVGGYIASAYFFTTSTSFANPAVTIGRVFTDTFAGIDPSSAAAFVPVQLLAALAAVLFMRWLYPSITSAEGHIVVPELQAQEVGT